MRTLRWLLVAPFAIAVWYVVLVAGVFVHSALETRLCPPQELVSGACGNPRVITILQIVVYVFVALSAVAVEVVAVATAPAHRDIIAWGTFAFGAAFAALLGAEGRQWGEAGAAIGAGLVTAICLHRVTRDAR